MVLFTRKGDIFQRKGHQQIRMAITLEGSRGHRRRHCCHFSSWVKIRHVCLVFILKLHISFMHFAICAKFQKRGPRNVYSGYVLVVEHRPLCILNYIPSPFSKKSVFFSATPTCIGHCNFYFSKLLLLFCINSWVRTHTMTFLSNLKTT